MNALDGCSAAITKTVDTTTGATTTSVTTEIGKLVKLDCLPVIFQNLILWFLIFAGIVALILIIVAGIKFITSGGDSKQAEGARKTLTYAIIGLVLVLLSFGILKFISQITGVKCITKFGFGQCKNYCEQDSDCPSGRYTCESNECRVGPPN